VQSIGLPPVASFVPLGGSSRYTLNSFQRLYRDFLQGPPPFHRRNTATIKQQSRPKSGTTIFLRHIAPHLHTVASCVRSGYHNHNTASFRFAATTFISSTNHLLLFVFCFVTRNSVEGRSTAFQPYYSYSPPFFQRLLLRSAIGFGSVR
jgi:hypothetical protein